MMKAKDCAVATALIIQGFLRANADEGPDQNLSAAALESRNLSAAIKAIRLECRDWAENLASGDAALAPDSISVELLEVTGGEVSRSPFNLLSAAVALAAEAIDLNGPEIVDQLIARLTSLRDARVSS